MKTNDLDYVISAAIDGDLSGDCPEDLKRILGAKNELYEIKKLYGNTYTIEYKDTVKICHTLEEAKAAILINLSCFYPITVVEKTRDNTLVRTYKIQFGVNLIQV